MVFRLREALGGVKHLRLRWQRVLSKHPPGVFINLYASAPFAVQQFRDYTGQTAVCEVCGYSLMRVITNDQWRIETCSAMPAIPHMQSREFNEWLRTLPGSKLPTPCV